MGSLRTALPTTLALLLSVAAATPAAAQTIRGTVVEQGTGEPVLGAFVVLIDQDGVERDGAMTDPDGSFVVTATRPGRYTLRADRIGYHSTTSPEIALARGEIVEHVLTAPVEAVTLGGIEVSSDPVCDMGPREADRITTAWTEARKALAATSWTGRGERFRLTIREFHREIDETEDEVVEDRSTVRESVNSESPFASLPADLLAKHGYVREDDAATRYYAPDAEVLLSDSFAEGHCFGLEPPDDDHEGMIGLAFEPQEERGEVDIRGVFWLDEQSAELRTMEYGYTGFPRNVTAEQAGGRVVFERLPNGAWIVSDWQVNVPAVREEPETEYEFVGDALVARKSSRRKADVVAVRETGGSVERINALDGSLLRSRETAGLVGTVIDSLAETPLAGAEVTIGGTVYRTRTDSLGRFRFGDLPGGRYTVTARHERTAELGLPDLSAGVTLEPGSTSSATLATPSLARVLAARCEPGEGVAVVGVVRDSTSETPLSGAAVDLRWTGPDGPAGTGTTADAAGRFVACGVPAGATVVARATFPGRSVREVFAAPAEESFVRRDLAVTEAPLASIVAVEGRADGDGAGTTVLGRVVDDETGAPLAGAQVVLAGTGQGTVADADGAFRLDGVVPGSHVLEIEFLGYATARARVTAAEGERIDLSARLVPSPIAADPLAVEALADPSDRGVGYTVYRLTSETIERYPVMGLVEMIALTVPGVTVGLDEERGCVVPFLRPRSAAGGSAGAPLVVLEGTPMANACDLHMMNAEDVEELEIVSGMAGAVQYGHRGQFGVIRVEIKSRLAQRGEAREEPEEKEPETPGRERETGERVQ